MIQYENVTRIFGEDNRAIRALDNVTFNIEKGNLAVFLGPSGCGKTTLLRSTNRLISLTSGKITIDNQDIMEWDEVKLRQSMGYAIQEIGLFPNKNIYDNIAVVPRLIGWEEKRIAERVEELLQMLQLNPDNLRERYPTELSGGQQQRVGVARCLAADPEILLMDEPFGAIDPINRDEIQNEFLRVQAGLKKTIAFVTHDIHEAIKMGDKIAIFQAGRLVQYDTPEVILTSPVNSYIADFVGSDRTLKVLGLLSARDAMRRGCDNCIQVSFSTSEAVNLFEKIDHNFLVVLKNSKPAGYIKREAMKGYVKNIEDVIESFPHIIEEKETLRDVLSHMLTSELDSLPVIDSTGDLSGTVSYRNIRKNILDIYSENSSYDIAGSG